MAVKLHPSIRQHPGSFLREEILAPYRLSVTEAAEHLGVTRVALSNLLNAKASLSPEMAIRFEKAFGVKAATMLRMQSAFDLARAEVTAASIKIERVPEPA